MKYKLAVFDLDGTILDTLEDLTNSVNYALKNKSLPERSLDEIRSFVGNGIRLLIQRAVPANTSQMVVDAVFDDFKEHYAIHSVDKTLPYDGIIPLLEKLKKAGIKIAVVSNKADFAVQGLVKKYFGNLFDFAVGERSGIEKKPAPDSVFEAMSVLDCQKDDTVYIGDSEVDIMTAKNADLDCICVDWGFRSTAQLISAGAKIIVSEPKKIADLIL